MTPGPIKPSPMARDLVRRFFPDYRGRKYRFAYWRSPRVLHTWWDGGSKDEYTCINLTTRQVQSIRTFHPGFQAGNWRPEPWDMPTGSLLIKRSYFCGRDDGITFYIRPEDEPTMPLLTSGAP